jgi:cellulose synthase/poly-beta-1,6-N-acetylglucosamine synthase-like glycosyltransferase/peptidoglycan/xylan/chitin deacetylase (PgdA/CDA1 family)/spore germination protein YaaH
MSDKSKQVFFDASGRRSPVVYSLVGVLVAFVGALVTVFGISVATTPALPSVKLNLEREYLSVLAVAHRTPTRSGPPINLAHARARVDKATSGTARFAFYVNWDKNSFLSLRSSAKHLDGLMPEWLHLTNATGEIELDDEREQQNVDAWLTINAPNLAIMPVVNNYDPRTRSWRGEEAARVLKSPEARARLVRNLKNYLAKGNFDGIVVDFKEIAPDAEDDLVAFLGELKGVLKADSRQLFAVVPAYAEPAHFHEIIEAVDRVVLLAYDQHAAHERPGPVASQVWFETMLDKHFATTHGSKLIVAIGSYAIDWARPGEGRIASIREMWDVLDRSGASFTFDPHALNPTFSYGEKSTGATHSVWMLDGVTMYNQVAAALAMEPGGLALWRLGTEDPTIWATFARGRAPDDTALAAIEKLDPGTEVTYSGKGEVLKFNNQPRVGKRSVTHLPKSNLITNQTIVSVPKPMMISRFGLSQDKVIALTFDDGPSRLSTPAILDVLKKKDVKASFFVLGTAAAMEPAILKRVYEEGHDIGNHTFTHPDLSEIPSAQLDLELNATQRVLESKLGIRTALFRPPFVRDIEPENSEQARTLLASAALGYITIGNRIDPLDWGRPGVDEIVRRTVSYAHRGGGNVVLLHDGGGDRSQTIAALPRIIDELRAEGYRFVTIHELLGLKRNDLMPTLDSASNVVPYVNGIGFSLMRAFNSFLGFLFVTGIVLGIGRLLIIGFVAWRQSRVRKPLRTTRHPKPSFAVIVPAHNEEKVIVDSIESLLGSRNKDFEIVVMDDGSTDRTYEVVKEAFGGNPRVQLLTKRNGGKSSALNHAIERTDVEVVVCIDADTRLAPDALDMLLTHFNDERVGAVAGVVTVGNRSTMLSRFQALEYLTAQSMDRRAFEIVNGIAVVPGAIGAWRRSALIEAGLYDSDTSAEDADATFKIARAGWLVRNEPKALAVTEAPEKIHEFNKQRFRWMFGMIQVAFKHRDIYFKRGANGLKWFTIPNIVVFQFLFTLFAPIMDALLVAALLADAWSYTHHGGSVLSSGTIEILAYWGVFQTLELAFAAVALWLHGEAGNWRLLPLTIVQRFYYRQLIFWISLRTLFAVLCGQFTGWGRAKRLGLPGLARTPQPPQPTPAPPAPAPMLEAAE